MGNALLVRKGSNPSIVTVRKDMWSYGNAQTDILDVGNSTRTCTVIAVGTSRVSSNYYVSISVYGSNDKNNWVQLDTVKKAGGANPLIYVENYTGYRYYRVSMQLVGDNSNVPFMMAYLYSLIEN